MGLSALKVTSFVLSIEELLCHVDEWRNRKQSIGFTCGAFDLFHAGHADYLERAGSLCDRLIVGVNSDQSVRSYKNPLRPIITEQHRIKLISSLRCVDGVTLMHETRPANLINLLKPDLYIKGGDYRKEQLKSASLVESYGGRCEVIPVEHDISTSAIIERIQELSLYALPDSAPKSKEAPIVFLDRDGTLIENKHFLKDPSKVELLPGVGEGLRALQDRGFQLVVVTNQQGLGLGYFDYDSFVAVNSVMLRQLGKFGVKIAKFYYCPHSLADECECRKPGARLIERALTDFKSKREDCFFIGDLESDMIAARTAGCAGILLTDKPLADKPGSAGSHNASSFTEATEIIIASAKQE